MGVIFGRDVVVVAASAGGVEALRSLLGGLPGDLRAAVMVVLHISPRAGSALPGTLDRSGPLKAAAAQDGEPLRHGHVYVAPPDLHLLLDGDAVRLSRGPRHNGHRPAADPLFLSAAAFAGPRTLAVVLSGTLDDGARGCAQVESRGGLVAVQDPEESPFDGMPRAAIAATARPMVAGLADIAAWIVRQSDGAREVKGETVDQELERELSPFYSHGALPRPPGDLSALTCPDCNGPLYEVPTSPNGHYQCIVGHAWSLESMIDGQGEAVERAFWVTILRLEERLRLMTRMLSTAQRHGQTMTARWLRRQVEQGRDTVKALRRLQSQSGWEAPVAVTEGDLWRVVDR
ncbi:chemotaxis protein CheB [Microbispora amethystogenes]|uniref:protein-glutamate methylesterase n=1 Tax=Microbispora amethystogenes TaxID=1427754 RepID=A0ABQ4FPA3_9ACTN|nr:chemotaxis protein CheB [Microbispora amethystogenes]GIH36640.1 chemotaxis protein CheB [Microbispora amethystogenes]